MKNIVLIGLMGSGKTTVGALLSERTGRELIDMDAYLEERFHMSIPAMFDVSEGYFRDHESMVCEEISQRENIIIATGGGVILRPENTAFLKRHGIIFYIDRPVPDIIADVTIAQRPLLKEEGAMKLYQLNDERHQSYLEACDHHIINDGTLDDLVNEILIRYDHDVKETSS